MAKLQVELVTAERAVINGEADFVKARGADGDLGILPQHIPLMTPLRPGELVIRNDNKEEILFVAGGFLQVLPDRVIILADAAERAEDIDQARAEEARRSAQQALDSKNLDDMATVAARAALERAIFRLQVSELRRRRQKQ